MSESLRKSSITPNIHLCESTLDFGPVYTFWIYILERYNDKLKKMNTHYPDGLEMTLMSVLLDMASTDTSLRVYSTNPSLHMIKSPLGVAQCIDNGHPPALPFSLPMFQQVVNNPLYNVIGRQLTTSLNSLVRMSIYLLAIKIGGIKSVNVWFFKMIYDMPFCQK
ncbi:hypothetical protein PHYBLDRAFT_73610 [Phycomyces blakesleeanus NRRL 1555(-)]|uniref:Uncharacterized protein n=1 Tax=Phycomyces blakesleeanus (strain ATCC 8743b / DSM 1359 / FGSC 10004 / NBRC 33097 / NRRL 1555) TaxID=763407 RepID=A0A167L9W0_PHYB8|nr:hypothetical protein PHYBLDRAFT_73610 [Phycomyces blakesleeanus NRRL 1555(-)]OAD69928.1 hypothetical protein PHYBLDRAFT_73610 [Phycomyces blakesleeanus NRRL 1555(-)]|eukprot:XP_018287968.1 hypothetical protein PHYBLDRAFT_73610 [Phycomyces blakesleeanus NRRL 1555(-)]